MKNYLTFRKRLSFIEKKVYLKGRLLDVGCNAGTFLSVAREKSWEAEGIEISAYIAEKARKLGYKVTEAPVTKTYWKTISYTKMFPIVDWWKILSPIILLKLKIRK